DEERHEAAAALRKVSRRAEELDLRRREIHRDRVARDRTLVRAERSPEIVARPHLEAGAPLAQTERGALQHEGDLDALPERALLFGDDRGAAALDDADLDARDVAAGRLEREHERGLVSHEPDRKSTRLNSSYQIISYAV